MIEIAGLTKWFPTSKGRHYVFRDVNLVIPSGVNVGIVGLNGAGKSTLLRLIGGLDQPDAGTVRCDGTISWPVGLAGGYQGSMSARENARFVCHIHGLDGPTIDRVLAYVREFCELGDFFDMPMNTYSPGMRARVGFAVSMAFAFDYYLLDEITAVGDETIRKKSMAALAAKKGHANYIMASNNVVALSKAVDLVLVVRRDGIRLCTDPDQAVAVFRGAA